MSQKTGNTDIEAVEQERQALTEQEVATYLRRHPDFFQDKPSLLTDLRIPHHTGGAVSLLERQVTVLRDAKEDQEKQLNDLIQIARDNDRLAEHMHRLTLDLMASRDIAVLLDVLNHRLQRDFLADLVAMRLFVFPLDVNHAGRDEIVADVDAFKGPFQRLLDAGKPFCGLLKSEQLAILFGDRAESVGSTAFLPLGERGNLGLLAICSYDRARFSPKADTVFLGRMKEIITAAIKPFLDSVSR